MLAGWPAGRLAGWPHVASWRARVSMRPAGHWVIWVIWVIVLNCKPAALANGHWVIWVIVFTLTQMT
jgi:hypothetical protein